ncbi:MAG: DUF2974 domain-containing protein [Clostridiales bacterium]|nr:DUF2974 domain-containing protein [Clostridiales bacterium]
MDNNMMAYLEWAGAQEMAQLPFNEVDALALSQVVYLPLEEAMEAVEKLPFWLLMTAMQHVKAEKVYEYLLRQRLALLERMGGLPRYKHQVVSRFVDEISLEDQMQFSAMTVDLPGGVRALCYRGTDSSLVGWKEDFNMGFESPVPAQRAALEYLRQAAAQCAGPLLLLGHSKGGNLAVYAAAFAEEALQQRIQAVYSFDGPGLAEELAADPGYDRVHDRILSYLPQGSMVGILLAQHKPYQVVSSAGIGPFQHDAFNWEVEPQAGRFVYLQERTLFSRAMEESVHTWLRSLSLEDRQLFSNTIYEILTAADDRHLAELMTPSRQRASKLWEAYRSVPPDVREGLLQALGSLLGGTLGGALSGVAQSVRDRIIDLLPDRFSRTKEALPEGEEAQEDSGDGPAADGQGDSVQPPASTEQ